MSNDTPAKVIMVVRATGKGFVTKGRGPCTYETTHSAETYGIKNGGDPNGTIVDVVFEDLPSSVMSPAERGIWHMRRSESHTKRAMLATTPTGEIANTFYEFHERQMQVHAAAADGLRHLVTTGQPRKAPPVTPAETREVLFEFSIVARCEFGCSDGSCVFGPPGGMHTNGGCRCFENFIDMKAGPNRPPDFSGPNYRLMFRIMAESMRKAAEYTASMKKMFGAL